MSITYCPTPQPLYPSPIVWFQLLTCITLAPFCPYVLYDIINVEYEKKIAVSRCNRSLSCLAISSSFISLRFLVESSQVYLLHSSSYLCRYRICVHELRLKSIYFFKNVILHDVLGENYFFSKSLIERF